MLKDRLCKICGVYKVQNKGSGKYRTICAQCHQNKYTRHKKDYCENCKFVALHRCQLDVDHIDGNHQNNSEDNLRTLCANCHRLKTYLSNEHFKL